MIDTEPSLSILTPFVLLNDCECTHTPFVHAVSDPLVHCGGVRARLGSELLGAMEEAMRDAPSFKLPFLILHGRNDSLVLPEGSEEFYQLVGTKKEDKMNRYYEGLRHDIFNELDKTPVQDVVAWLEEQYSK